MRSISAGIYESRLTSEARTEKRSIQITGPRHQIHKSAGLIDVPVPHDGDTFESDDEAQVIREIVSELHGHTLSIDEQAPRHITPSDILVVAPFNLQVEVAGHSTRCPSRNGSREFQGQEAPIVIFSMTASEGDSAPRGIEFLFDKHRLNVAISRAQILAVVVGSPKLSARGRSIWTR